MMRNQTLGCGGRELLFRDDGFIAQGIPQWVRDTLR